MTAVKIPADLDRLIHEPARFYIVSHLFVVKKADFVMLARQTSMTGGNLSSHMTKLEKAGYVAVEKSFVDKRPQTVYQLTRKGRNAFVAYRETMARMLQDSVPSESRKSDPQ